MKKTYQEILDYCLAEGNGDCIGLWEISGDIAAIAGVDEYNLPSDDMEKFMQALSQFIPIILSNGFKVASGSSTTNKYELWPDQTPAAVTAKIRQEWTSLKGRQPDVGFIAYFFKNGSVPSKLAGFE